MATLETTPLSGNFDATLFQFLKTPGIEGYKDFVYADSREIPTLGVGYALIIGPPGNWQPRNPADIEATFASAGINLVYEGVSS